MDFVLSGGGETPDWLAETTRMIPEWRADVHDVYTRWAITINAMVKMAEKYDADPSIALTTSGLRVDAAGTPKYKIFDTWAAEDTARNYKLSIPIIYAYAFVDLFGLLEEIIFDAYLIFLAGDPSSLMAGDEFRHLRKTYGRREQGKDAWEEWESAWSARLSDWRMKQGYKGLHTTFLAYYSKSKLKRPSNFNKTTVDDWARTIELIGEARNLIVHGVGDVSQKLSDLSKNNVSNVFDFKVGAPLEITMLHLMAVELFYTQLLSAWSTGLLELAHGPAMSVGR